MTTPGGLVLRLAVVVGATALLAGIAGWVLLALRPDIPTRGDSAPTGSQVRVLGEAAIERAQHVEVEWFEDGTRITQSARRGEAPGVWVLPPVPEGRHVTLRVRRGVEGELVHQVAYDAGLPAEVELVVDERGD